jgi:hypothetical protein
MLLDYFKFFLFYKEIKAETTLNLEYQISPSDIKLLLTFLRYSHKEMSVDFFVDVTKILNKIKLSTSVKDYKSDAAFEQSLSTEDYNYFPLKVIFNQSIPFFL